MSQRTVFAAIALAAAAFARGQELLPESDASSAYPVVLTPTRLRQALTDVPASVTIIRAETMARYGITNVVDALRMVPGMEITEASGPDVRINYHGTNILTPRRMNVLIDGVSVYQPAFARVDWKNLPVAMEDIDRVEITRGPDSATYGPNSMTAIINIITKHPTDLAGATIATTFGSLGTVGVTGRFGASLGETAVSLTASRDRDSGYDTSSRANTARDSTALDRLNLRSLTKLSGSSSFKFDAGYVGGTRQVASIGDPYQTSFPDQHVTDYYLSGTLTTAFSPYHELRTQATFWRNQVTQRWTTCTPTALLLPQLFDLWRANPAYANAVIGGRVPSGGTAADNALAAAALTAIAGLGPRARQPTCSAPNQDLVEDRADIEVQDTFVWSDRLRVVSGMGVREQRGDSRTYLAGSVSSTLWRAFANMEYKPATWLGLNAGGYLERNQLSGSTFSPRLAANLHLSASQTLRFVWSTGTRTPDIEEQRANWSYNSKNATPLLDGSSDVRFYQSALAPGSLSSEHIVSTEIGYLQNVSSIGLLLDVKAFDDHLTDLISEKLQLSNFEPTNSNSVRLSGGEVQGDLELSSSWTAFAHYAYLRNHGASTPLEQTQYSQSSGSAGLSHSFGEGWRWAVAYYGASGDGLGQTNYGREDLTVGRAFSLTGSRISVSLVMRRLDNKASSYYRDVGDIPRSAYERRVQIFGQIKVSF